MQQACRVDSAVFRCHDKVRRATDTADAMTAAIARTPEASAEPVSGKPVPASVVLP